MLMNFLVSLPLLLLLQGTIPSVSTTDALVAAYRAASTTPPEHLNAQTPEHPNTRYSIPYRLDETQHLAVRARINGHGPFNFIMDTGAPAVYLAKDVAARCGVKPDAAGWGTFARMEIEGGAVVEQIQARIEEPFQLQGMNALGMAAKHIDGVLGYNLLARFRIQIDMTDSKMIWTPSGLSPEIPLNIGKLTEAEKAVMKKAGKSQDEMEGLAKMATTMLSRQSAPQTVRRGFFGMELADSAQGPRIHALLPGSPAALAGLEAGDIIIKLVPPQSEPAPIHDSAALQRYTANVAPGENVIFVLLRGAQRLKRTVRAGKEGF